MTEVRDFAAALARAGNTFAEIKTLCEASYGDQALKKTQIYAILRKVKGGKDQRHLNPQKTKRRLDTIAAVAAAVEEEPGVTVRDLAHLFGLFYETIEMRLRGLLWRLRSGFSTGTMLYSIMPP